MNTKDEPTSVEKINNPDGSYVNKRVHAKPDKNESWLYLREYEKPKNKIYSEITKFDKEYKIVYLKQYKFKGLLAKILFWFAR